MRLLIAGSRNFIDYATLYRELQPIQKEITEIISGGARGADKLGECYANLNNIPIKIFPANWSLGKQAGMLRNIDMGEYCDRAILFWDGKSKGTKHMIDILNKNNKPYKVIYFKEEKC